MAIKNIFGRYLFVLILSFGNLWIFYKVFTPLTIYPTKALLSLFGNAKILSNNIIEISGIDIILIPACIGGAAYYLLFILNMSMPLKLGKRIKSLALIWGAFLSLNIIRIAIFAGMANTKWFEIAHKETWYFGSTVMVVAIWFISIRILKIKEIPFVTDIREFIKEVNSKNEKILKVAKRGNN